MTEFGTAKVYEFEGYRLDTKSHSLVRLDGGDLVPLTSKVAELLICLVENAGRVVTKNELFDTIWPGAFVEESNLSQSVFMLRKALGDHKRIPRYILTRPNRGYQFIAPVVEIDRNSLNGTSTAHRTERRGTSNNEAYESYVRGRFFWNKRTGDSLKKAVEHFEEAIRLDPNFAHAYTGLADSYQLLSEFYAAALKEESFPKAREAANKALQIDDQLAEAHTSLAYAQAFYDWDWDAAAASFRYALELNPNYATAHQWYADYLNVTGRFDDAFHHMNRAIELDPSSPVIAAGLAGLYYTQRNADELIRQARAVIEMDADYAYGHFFMGFGYEFKGMFKEAVDAFATAASLFGEPDDIGDELRAAYRSGGMESVWHTRLEQYATREHLKKYPSYLKSLVPIRLGDTDTSLKWLDRAYRERDRGIIYAKHEPLLESLRDNPRFKDIIHKIGLDRF